jgi:hypothetical protein
MVVECIVDIVVMYVRYLLAAVDVANNASYLQNNARKRSLRRGSVEDGHDR